MTRPEPADPSTVVRDERGIVWQRGVSLWAVKDVWYSTNDEAARWADLEFFNGPVTVIWTPNPPAQTTLPS